MQKNADADVEAKKIEHPQPAVLVRGETKKPHDAYICTEGQVLCSIPLDEATYALLCVFYTFNMQYTSGCTNFYSFLEYIFLGVTPPKRCKLQHFITSITNTMC